MLRGIWVVLALWLATTSGLRAQDPVEVIFEDLGKKNSRYSYGVEIYMINNEDFAFCYHPGFEKKDNITGEWAADVIRLDPGKEKIFIGRWMANSLNENWTLHLGGRFSTECL